ncbi:MULTISPECIES: cation:proton antiporter [Arthrobacter]|uniref:Cation:proton antiporter n=1 Tax=Arthrobacter terricola TaxID=2547396 RepID=A0A4R5K9G8_9MICC|nr:MULTISPECIES: cation:proton antiporter [Arthrobacter]MBT8159985.1 cation:proton antiporter [Arthrobacter sp. GN70]TDF91068.1 cation:proton antiporter [Arthrobacter terricola]
MSFFQLSLIAAVALLGPLLALPRKWHLPVVLGQLLAGIVIGRTGFALVNSSDPTFTFMADVGFALIMFVAGTHVPVRDKAIRPALGSGALRAGVAAVLAVAVGIAIAFAFGTGHAPLYIVLLASSSAALVLPIVDSLRLGGPKVLTTTAQVAIADIACIVALPLAVDPPNALRAAAGAAVVALCAAVLFFVLRWLETSGTRGRVHDVSEDRKFALELRVQLALLFALGGLAVSGHVSIMLAGFSFGLVVSAVGEPRRLAHQLFAVSDGFLGPVFFVWLGASLDLRTLAGSPRMILLGICLGFGTLLVHGALRALGQPLPLAILAASQLGVPVAAATIGTQLHLLEPGEAAAMILGALISIGASTLAGSRAARTFSDAKPDETGKGTVAGTAGGSTATA